MRSGFYQVIELPWLFRDAQVLTFSKFFQKNSHTYTFKISIKLNEQNENIPLCEICEKSFKVHLEKGESLI